MDCDFDTKGTSRAIAVSRAALPRAASYFRAAYGHRSRGDQIEVRSLSETSSDAAIAPQFYAECLLGLASADRGRLGLRWVT
jgi:hypothetical protein